VNSETHFKVLIVSPVFDTIPTLVGRHRLVNTILADELSQSGPIHALSIVAKTPAQWQQQQQQNGTTTTIEPSPPCLGGDGSLPPKNLK
jgi:BolA-like protein 1